MRGLRRTARRVDHRVVHRAAAILLGYPGPDLYDRLPLVRDALGEVDDPAAVPLVAFLDEIADVVPAILAERYVEVFDLDRKHPLHLSYLTDGDTRRRGEVLAAFKQVYRDSGLLVDLDGELPDYLPMVLELAAHDPERGGALLEQYRPSVELLRLALEDATRRGPVPWLEVLRGVCATYAGAPPRDRAEAMAMAGAAGGPPAETVGLDAYDPRLLPLTDNGTEGRR